VPIGEFTSVPVGSGNTFIAAMQQGKIDAGMTSEPTISRLLKTAQAKILVDMRSVELTRQALGGVYPATCLYMQTEWVDDHHDDVQKLANAFVKTLRYIASHSAEEIAAHMPRDYYAGDKELYIHALATGKQMFTVDGVMPLDGPPTVLKVLSTFDRTVKGKTIDLSKTYTTSFARSVQATN
jgi:NitT/TauT family transport system substrate-binding protein